jgi:ribosomal protein L15E
MKYSTQANPAQTRAQRKPQPLKTSVFYCQATDGCEAWFNGKMVGSDNSEIGAQKLLNRAERESAMVNQPCRSLAQAELEAYCPDF